MSNSGRLFFDSPDALVPQDINGLEDVYEYEPTGEGSCTEATRVGYVCVCLGRGWLCVVDVLGYVELGIGVL